VRIKFNIFDVEKTHFELGRFGEINESSILKISNLYNNDTTFIEIFINNIIMKVGEKLLCKKSRHTYCNADSYYLIYKIYDDGKTIDLIANDGYAISFNFLNTNHKPIDYYNLYDYFYTTKELRKIKMMEIRLF